MLDLVSRGAKGHGPVHLLLISAAEMGFAWDGEEEGWVRVALPPLRMLTGPVQHFYSSILDAWRCGISARLSERKVFFFWLSMLTSKDIHNHLPLPICGKEIKMLLRSSLCGRVWNGLLLGKAKKEDVPCRFCGKGWRWSSILGMFFAPYSARWGYFLSLSLSCPWIVVIGHDVFCGMAVAWS